MTLGLACSYYSINVTSYHQQKVSWPYGYPLDNPHVVSGLSPAGKNRDSGLRHYLFLAVGLLRWRYWSWTKLLASIRIEPSHMGSKEAPKFTEHFPIKLDLNSNFGLGNPVVLRQESQICRPSDIVKGRSRSVLGRRRMCPGVGSEKPNPPQKCRYPECIGCNHYYQWSLTDSKGLKLNHHFAWLILLSRFQSIITNSIYVVNIIYFAS